MQRFPHQAEIPHLPWVVIDHPPEEYDEIERVLFHANNWLSPLDDASHARFSVAADDLLERGDARGPALVAALHGANYIVVTPLNGMYPTTSGEYVPTLIVQNVGRDRLAMRRVITRLYAAWGVEVGDRFLDPERGCWLITPDPDDIPWWTFVARHDDRNRRFLLQSLYKPKHRGQPPPGAP